MSIGSPATGPARAAFMVNNQPPNAADHTPNTMFSNGYQGLVDASRRLKSLAENLDFVALSVEQIEARGDEAQWNPELQARLEQLPAELADGYARVREMRDRLEVLEDLFHEVRGTPHASAAHTARELHVEFGLNLRVLLEGIAAFAHSFAERRRSVIVLPSSQE
ncbi:hypothetical protein H9P43_008429 [Blastocladiella emersonii ATCC 22665]|nr:hypothetical protein H9P43_008429 [Blastocladiella emersonii ATCC 22665]